MVEAKYNLIDTRKMYGLRHKLQSTAKSMMEKHLRQQELK